MRTRTFRVAYRRCVAGHVGRDSSLGQQRHLRYATEEARAVAQRRKDEIHRHQEGGTPSSIPSAQTTPSPLDD